LPPEAINGSLYWDDVLSQLFIRYANGGAPTWVAAAPSAGSLAAATLAEAQAGTVNLKYSSPETAVPKNASGMTGSAYIPAGNTAARPAAAAYAGQLRYNTQIPQLEYSDGTNWVSPGFPSGTTMLFAQAAAPTGWTQVTTWNDRAVRIVSGAGAGTGGTIGFSSFFTNPLNYSGSITFTSGSTAGTTLTTAQIPSHTHPISGGGGTGAFAGPFDNSGSAPNTGIANNLSTGGLAEITANVPPNTNSSGGDGAHSHSLVGGSANANFSSNFSLQYLDIIVASKN
jgi:hypothetical protein